MAVSRPFLIGTLASWVVISLVGVLAMQRGEQASVAWLIWPASVAGAVVAERLMRLFERTRRLESELEEARRQSREALRRQSELSSALAQVRTEGHRVAQPLTAVMGYSELLRRRCQGLSPACDQQFENLKEAIDQLAVDLEQLRETARRAHEGVGGDERN
jgi:signal transduction histidine kinase